MLISLKENQAAIASYNRQLLEAYNEAKRETDRAKRLFDIALGRKLEALGNGKTLNTDYEKRQYEEAADRSFDLYQKCILAGIHPKEA